MERWLDVFRKNIAGVVLTGHSPDPHFPIYVILTDNMMTDIDGAAESVHSYSAV